METELLDEQLTKMPGVVQRKRAAKTTEEYMVTTIEGF
jgi:hypothetical protein